LKVSRHAMCGLPVAITLMLLLSSTRLSSFRTLRRQLSSDSSNASSMMKVVENTVQTEMIQSTSSVKPGRVLQAQCRVYILISFGIFSFDRTTSCLSSDENMFSAL